MNSEHQSAPYADAYALVSRALRVLEPAKRLMVDEYAAEHRWLSNTGGGYVGRWQHEMAPYLAAPMRCLNTRLYLTVAVVGPGQSGKTSIAENWLLQSVETDPADLLWYMQTDKGVESYVKSRINPMIDAHAGMKSRLGKRPIDDSIGFKRFSGMIAEFLSGTHSNLINKKAGRIVADEIDAWDQSSGDPKVLLDIRRQTYGRASTLLAMSHPDLATGIEPKFWRAGIMRVYYDSDRRVWYWPCPHCEAWSSPVPTAKRVMTLEYPVDAPLDVIEREAYLKCPVSGCVIYDHQRREMNLAAYRSPFGGWVGEGQELSEGGEISGELVRKDTAGFWIVGVMSPFLLNGIGGLARERAKAELELETGGDDRTLKEVVVKQYGFPHASAVRVGSTDVETLVERAKAEDQPLGVVPDDVRFLTAWIDIQIAHFEVLIRGWGCGSESWVIDKRRQPADTTTDTRAWVDLLAGLIAERFPLASDPANGMRIRAIGYDSQGAPGTWDRANETWRRLRDSGLIRNYGTLDGRDVWSVAPTQGASTLSAALLQVVYPDNQKRTKGTARVAVPVIRFNANQFKDMLAGQLKRALPGPTYVHLPAKLLAREAPHSSLEQMVSEQRDAIGRWKKPHGGVRNEMLDLMVGCQVLAHLHGLTRINWDKPPAWADVGTNNPMISPLAEPHPATENRAAAPTVAEKPRRTIGSIMQRQE